MNRSRQFQKLNWTGSIILVRLVVALSGWLSCFSLLLQLFWDAVGADLIGTEYAAQDMRLDETIVKCCLQLGIFRQSIRSSCAGSADTLIKASLIGSVLTCWWNRKLGEKIGRPQARWLGRGNQFQLQALVLLIRITAWGILINPGNFSLSMMMRNTVHLFMLVFITLVIHLHKPKSRLPTDHFSHLLPHTSWSASTIQAASPHNSTKKNPPALTPYPSRIKPKEKQIQVRVCRKDILKIICSNFLLKTLR